MTPEKFAANLAVSKMFFDRSTKCLDESHSSYKPKEEMMTVAQQVAHVANTFDWFIDGAFNRPDGFDMNPEVHTIDVLKVESLAEARAWLDKSVEGAMAVIASKSMEELLTPLPEGPVMGGEPKLAILGAMEEHTAHHRGALSVYSRLIGLVPDMPYMDMES